MLLSVFSSLGCYASNIIKTVTPLSGGGKSTEYKQEILLRALELTQKEYGKFTIENTPVNMKPDRAIHSIIKNDLINVAIIAANKLWDENTLVIKTPIRGGTLSYRLLLINKEDKLKFSNIHSIEELNQLTAGLQNDWSTTKLFEASHLPIIKSQNFEGLFLMLDNQRIDYIPRAIYEAFDELSDRQENIKNVVIAPNIALYIPMVSYIYVSPKTPSIAKRISLGLDKMLERGELKTIFDRYYSQDVARAKLKGRTIIEIENPYFKGDFDRNQKLVWTLH